MVAKNKVARHPEASLSPSFSLSLFLMYTTDNTIHKEPFLSYLSSCFRYFCKLQGAGIINHRETRWQSVSIVAKKTNETTHPGKWPGDLVWYWLPTVTEMWYTGSLSLSCGPPWCALSWPRPDKATKANQWGSLSVYSITGTQAYFRFGWVLFNRHRGHYSFIWERGIELCVSASWYSLW